MEIKDIIRVETLPKIYQQLEQLSVEIDNQVNQALSLECNEESKQDVKKARANLNKIKTELEDRRKLVKEQILEPYMNFEKVYNELIKDKLVYADNTLKDRINLIELTQITEKTDIITDYFNEYCQSLHLQDIVNWDQLNIRIGLSDTAVNVGFEMRIYKERGHKGRYDVIVAASDSTDEDKAIADIVCDGENDELDLQFAVNWNFFRRVRTIFSDKCNVLLMPGTYNIDNFSQQYASNGQLMRNAYAVCMGNEPYNSYGHYNYRMSIEGCYSTENAQGEASVLIKVTDNGVSSLNENINNAILGLALSSEGTTGSFHMNNMSICISNLCIYANGYRNKVIGIDAYQAGNVCIKDVSVYTCTVPYIQDSYIQLTPEGSIGIRAGRGSCAGVRQRIEGCRIQGFHEGIAICGEHFIIQDNLEVGCYYGFTTNNYPVGGAVQHPNVFIGNSVEQCHCMGKLGESGMRTTIVYIGGSVENTNTQGETPIPMLPIEIAENTQNRGRIESDSLSSPYNESMFETGRGSSFEQIIYPYVQA